MPTQPPPEGLTVIGEVTRVTRPETVELSFDVHSAGPTAAHALRENAMKVTQIGQALMGVGAAKADVQPGAATVYPIFQPSFPALSPPGAPQLAAMGFGNPSALVPFAPVVPEGPQLAGYHAVSFLKLSLHDVARLGDLVDTATRAGANVSSGFLFRLRDEPALRRSMLQEAGRDAREKAETLAGALGKSLGDPVAVQEDFAAYQMHSANGDGYRLGPFLMAPTGTMVRVPFTPGELTFHTRVSVTYRLQ